MYNPMTHELAAAVHHERVAEGLRRAARASGKPPNSRRRARRRFQLRLRMA